MSLPSVNIFDYLFIFLAMVYVYEEVSFRILASLKHDIFMALAYFSALFGYSYLSSPLQIQFSFTKNTADALSVVAILATTLPVLYFVSLRFKDSVQFTSPGEIPNKAASFVLGVFSFFLIMSLVITLLLSFPTSMSIKTVLLESFFGKNVSLITQKMEINLKKSIGQFKNETLLFQTKPPLDTTLYPLRFSSQRQSNYVVITHFLDQINASRTKHNIPPLEKDTSLTQVAQAHADNMGMQGYLSHYAPGNISLFDRLEAANVSAVEPSESIAFAQSADHALQGLLSIKEDEAVLLSPRSQKAGIGVIDAQTLGIIFVVVVTQ